MARGVRGVCVGGPSNIHIAVKPRSLYFQKETSHREMKRARGDVLSSGGFLGTRTCASARLRTHFRQIGLECGEARPLQTHTHTYMFVFPSHLKEKPNRFRIILVGFLPIFAHGSARLEASIKFNCPANVSACRRAREG